MIVSQSVLSRPSENFENPASGTEKSSRQPNADPEKEGFRPKRLFLSAPYSTRGAYISQFWFLSSLSRSIFFFPVLIYFSLYWIKWILLFTVKSLTMSCAYVDTVPHLMGVNVIIRTSRNCDFRFSVLDMGLHYR